MNFLCVFAYGFQKHSAAYNLLVRDTETVTIVGDSFINKYNYTGLLYSTCTCRSRRGYLFNKRANK